MPNHVHDPVTRTEIGECAFCDNPIPVYDEGTLVAVNQILVGDAGVPFYVCDTCFRNATRGTEQTMNYGGVNVLHAVAK